MEFREVADALKGSGNYVQECAKKGFCMSSSPALTRMPRLHLLPTCKLAMKPKCTITRDYRLRAVFAVVAEEDLAPDVQNYDSILTVEHEEDPRCNTLTQFIWEQFDTFEALKNLLR